MKLADIKDYIKENVSGMDSYTIGRIDTTKGKAVCVYTRPSSDNKTAVGSQSTYKYKKICVFIRYGTGYSDAEEKAQEVYDLFNGPHANIGDEAWFFNMEFDGPVPLGTDEKGIYEFTVELTIMYKEV